MKKLSMAYKIWKNQKFLKLVIISILFFVLYVISMLFSRFNQLYGDYNYYKDTPISNALVYMNKYMYNLDYGSKSITNLNEIENNNKKIEKYFLENKDLFQGISPKKIDYYFKDTKNSISYSIKMYDKISFNFMERDLIKGKIEDYEKDNIIPALLNEDRIRDFNMGDIIKAQYKDKVIKFVVSGFLDKNYRRLELGFIGNTAGSITDLFGKNYSEYNTNQISLVIPENEIIPKLLYDDNPLEYNIARILYFKDKISEEKKAKISKFIEDNDMGYYSFTTDSLDNQVSRIKQHIQQNADNIFVYFSIVIITFIAIAYINRKLLQDRFYKFYLNGAKIIDIYASYFLYFFAIIIIAMVLYNFYSYFVSSSFAFENLKFIPGVYRASMNDIRLGIKENILVFIGLIILISIIAYLPIIDIKRKRGKLWEY